MRAFIYDGEGVAPGCRVETFHSLQRTGFKCERVRGERFCETDLSDTCDLIVFPGGRASPFAEALGEAGCQNILQFVRNGGRYLGLCAGAYFACTEIEFAKGLPHEILTGGGLSFFRGAAVGPAHSPDEFQYNSERNAHVLRLQGAYPGPVYYNGGCWFRGADSNVEILAYYEGSELPAVVGFSYGKGRVLLSGVHIEYSYQSAEEGSELRRELSEHENIREKRFQALVNWLISLN